MSFGHDHLLLLIKHNNYFTLIKLLIDKILKNFINTGLESLMEDTDREQAKSSPCPQAFED